jgi:Fe-S-cluster containining protein
MGDSFSSSSLGGSRGPEGFCLDICAHCQAPICCEIEPPFLTERDVERIVTFTGEPRGGFLRQGIVEVGMSPVEMEKGQDRKCIFYDRQHGACQIYPVRPIDCILFPLDILMLGERCVWIQYTSCGLPKPHDRLCALELCDLAERNLLPELLPYIVEYARTVTTLQRSGHWRTIRDVQLQDAQLSSTVEHSTRLSR